MKELEESFLKAHESHSNQIFRFIFFKLGDREKAKELIQETFMKTWIHISKNGEIENIRSFLYRVAGNLVIDEYRRNGRASSISLDYLTEEGYDFSNDEKESYVDRIDGAQILELLKSLPDSYSEVLFMRYVEELDITEIADSIGESNNVVSVRLNRGIKKLKEMVKDKIK